jgi:hypothetical protein
MEMNQEKKRVERIGNYLSRFFCVIVYAIRTLRTRGCVWCTISENIAIVYLFRNLCKIFVWLPPLQYSNEDLLSIITGEGTRTIDMKHPYNLSCTII